MCISYQNQPSSHYSTCIKTYHRFRELGRIKGGRKQFEDQVEVAEADIYELTPDDEETRDKFWHNADAQHLLRSLARLRKGHQLVCREDILDDLEEAEQHIVQKTKLTILLRKFCDKNLLFKEPKKDKEVWYRIKSIERLVPFMNTDEEVYGDIPDSYESDAEDEESDSQVVLSNVSMVSSVHSDKSTGSGTKDDPIILLDEASDDGSISTLSVTTAGKKTSLATKVISPETEKEEGSAGRNSYVGRRVARYFHGRVYFGTITKDCGNDKWVAKFDDEDVLDFNKQDLRRGLGCYKTHQSKDNTKPSSSSTSSSDQNLTDIEDIPLGNKSDRSQRGTFIVQKDRKRRVYYAGRDDTSISIAKRFKVDARQIVLDNKRRPGYGRMNQKTKFELNSPIVLPPAVKEEEEEDSIKGVRV